MRLAEAQYLEGDYRGSHRTLRASIRRNRDEAAGYPEPVASLYRADARLDWHLGLDDLARQSTYSTLESLRAGIPQEDHRHFTARLEIAEMQVRSRNLPEARRQLADLARAARASGREDVAARAELNSLWMDFRTGRRAEARARIAELAGSTDPARRAYVNGAKLLMSRIHRLEGDEARADALLGEIDSGPGNLRQLLYAPPYHLVTEASARQPRGLDTTEPVIGLELLDYEEVASRYSTATRLPAHLEDKWIDVSFQVRPDGRVDDVRIVRQGSPASWAGSLLESIRGRRYSTAPQASTRLERYTYTADYEARTGTRYLVRSPRVRIEYVDLTDETAAAEARPPSR